ncbi:hypothetical protein K437DRAFT_256812 [Tilletiaria anomala UBC 951]|uniref:precorrin-2 dehydrogenase n=1 Tax=Tilletiaria anomala (strain ATCC 24038 / CBS 436.72 / UBC 951) TaxID=1037660 RepID=A0A066VTB2_TILAU|nr:uncharacterized protein K437DRAFT_256812 [Tilletiaria anomala UBC 951]KDN44947.1 hypothetical protein K437DRAFT_256812 [Tilletiaria anomala UBC 951]
MAFPAPQPGASLLLAHRMHQSGPLAVDSPRLPPEAGYSRRTVLIIGTSRLAASRLYACAEAGAWPVVVAPPAPEAKLGAAAAGRSDEDMDTADVAEEIKHRVHAGECSFLSLGATRARRRFSRSSLLQQQQQEQGQEQQSIFDTDEDGRGGGEEALWTKLLDALDRIPAPTNADGLDQKQLADDYTASIHAELCSSDEASCRQPSSSPDSALPPQIFAACITNTLHTSSTPPPTWHPNASAESILGDGSSTMLRQAHLLTRLCRARRIPLTVADHPELCDFSFPATHRFALSAVAPAVAHDTDSLSTPTRPRASCLQIAVTTNGKGCRLAGRIRREVVTLLPRNVADAVENVGMLRALAKDHDQVQQRGRRGSGSRSRGGVSGNSRRGAAEASGSDLCALQEDDESFDPVPLNLPVAQLCSTAADPSGSYCSAVLVRARQRGDAQREEAERDERTRRRMRWVAQMSEYWPIDYLGNLNRKRMVALLDEYHEREEQGTPGAQKAKQGPGYGDKGEAARKAAFSANGSHGEEGVTGADENSSRGRSARSVPKADEDEAEAGQVGISAGGSWAHRRPSQHSLIIPPPPPQPPSAKGHIYILGSGPGHPALLTLFAHSLLTSPETHLVLSDKLVPSAILSLIPPTTPLVIARKFPGNAEGAQSELIALALKAAVHEGKTVVRLKQGDPFVYGRGGEEVLAFRKAGIESTVVPGISSALAAPAMLGIAVTQRGAADSLVLCTGVGRGGKKVKLPGYERGCSLVILMGVARLQAVVDILTRPAGRSPSTHEAQQDPDRDGAPFPPYLPIAIVERASSADQRVIASTLEGIVAAIEHVGEQRPPGMILIGWTVLALEGEGDTTVLDDAAELADAVTVGADGDDDNIANAQHEDHARLTREHAEQELSQRDLARVARWLNGRRHIVREGLDQPYMDALRQAKALQLAPIHSAEGTPRARSPVRGKAAPVAPAMTEQGVAQIADAVGMRSQHGWAEGRYRGAAPQGGWTPDEDPNRPAADMARYAADLDIPNTLRER